MLVTQNAELFKTQDFRKYVFGNEEHYLKGFMYVPGFRAGEESVKEIHRALTKKGKIPFDRICGVYTYCVKNAGTWPSSSAGGGDFDIIFVACNSEMHCFILAT